MKRGEIDEHIGCTHGRLRSQIRSALRLVWRNSARRAFVEMIRFPYGGKSGRGKYGVMCTGCGRVMGQSEREHVPLKNGSLSKRKKLAYEIDHIKGNPPFTCMEELGAYAQSLFFGDLCVLCFKCHGCKTNGKQM